MWSAELEYGLSAEAAMWCQLLRNAGVPELCRERIFDQPQPGILLAESPNGIRELHYRTLILATGARERFLPFPGWTLPNVMGAGGLQAMVKSGLPVAGKKIVIAGSGPLLLAVAKYMRSHGANLRLVAEQADQKALMRFGMSLAGHPG